MIIKYRSVGLLAVSGVLLAMSQLSYSQGLGGGGSYKEQHDQAYRQVEKNIINQSVSSVDVRLEDVDKTKAFLQKQSSDYLLMMTEGSKE